MNILYIIDNRVAGSTGAYIEKFNKNRFGNNDNIVFRSHASGQPKRVRA